MSRYLPHTDETRAFMLNSMGKKNMDELYIHVPKEALNPEELNTGLLPLGQSEMEVEAYMQALAAKNLSTSQASCFIGAGYYKHHIPATVDHLIQRGEFLTAYTPYQPEVSQGTLQLLFEFQSYIACLTGQEIANASMYDGSTATAEAALMALRLNKKAHRIHIANGLHPHYTQVLKTYLNHSDVMLEENTELSTDSACLIVQNPNFYGEVVDLTPYKALCEKTGAKLIVVVTEIVSLGLLPAPSEADIVVGEAQSIGNPLSFGGPALGFFATQKEYVRQMPGRLCGETTDADGKRGYVLTLNTREQHIRREKATSNICTNEGLCALAFTIHMSLLGESGFKKLAQINHERACFMADQLSEVKGLTLENQTFFNEMVFSCTTEAEKIVTALQQKNILAGVAIDSHKLLLCATETNTKQQIIELKKELEQLL